MIVKKWLPTDIIGPLIYLLNYAVSYLLFFFWASAKVAKKRSKSKLSLRKILGCELREWSAIAISRLLFFVFAVVINDGVRYINLFSDLQTGRSDEFLYARFETPGRVFIP